MYSIDDYQTIVQQFETVLKTLDKLGVHIQSKLIHYPVWVDSGKSGFISNREKLVQALMNFKLPSGVTPQETYTCPGAVGATKQTLELVVKVNQAKDAFKSAVQDFLAKQPANPYPTRKVRRILALSGYPAVMLKQVYRHLAFIDYHPRRIGWTRAKSGSHVVISQQKARELLLKAEKGRHIDIQLAKLSQLKQREKLVIFHEIKQSWIANVASFKNREGRSAMQKIRCALPVFYLHNGKSPLPEICFSSKINRNTKTHRLDKKIQDKPFLNSINAYLYIDKTLNTNRNNR